MSLVSASKSPCALRAHHRRPVVLGPLAAVKQQPQWTQQELDTAEMCSHPDAIRRRMEMQEWARRREEERMQAQLAAQQGLKWFQAPSTMVSCESEEDYHKLIHQATAEGRLLVAKMFTEDCYVCRTLFPKLRKIAADNPDVLWVKLNGSDPAMVSLFSQLGISKVPLFHFVLNGQLVAELTASLSPEKLAAFRAELAAHKPTQSAATAAAATAALE